MQAARGSRSSSQLSDVRLPLCNDYLGLDGSIYWVFNYSHLEFFPVIEFDVNRRIFHVLELPQEANEFPFVNLGQIGQHVVLLTFQNFSGEHLKVWTLIGDHPNKARRLETFVLTQPGSWFTTMDFVRHRLENTYLTGRCWTINPMKYNVMGGSASPTTRELQSLRVLFVILNNS